AAVFNVFKQFAKAARDAGLVIVPAMAFYGGFGGLFSPPAMGGGGSAGEIAISSGLGFLVATPRSRFTGARNPGPRFVFSHNKLERGDPPPARVWNFPAPFGPQDVEGLSFAETITISHHLHTPEIRAYMNLAPLKDIRNPETPPPTAADES